MSGRHPVLIGAVLLSGPLAFCVGTAVLGWMTDAGGKHSIVLPLAFVGLWIVYMGWWTYALLRLAKGDKRRGFPVNQDKPVKSHHAPQRFDRRFF
jgi:hypothetical protein